MTLFYNILININDEAYFFQHHCLYYEHIMSEWTAGANATTASEVCSAPSRYVLGQNLTQTPTFLQKCKHRYMYAYRLLMYIYIYIFIDVNRYSNVFNACNF